MAAPDLSDQPTRQYRVTEVAGAILPDYPTDLTELGEIEAGISVEPGDSEILFSMDVTADSAAEARQIARESLRDLLVTLSASFVGYRRSGVDQRASVGRLGAPYIADGPAPALEVLDGGFGDEGLAEFDPDEQLRRSGTVVQFRAVATKGHPCTLDVRRFRARAEWPDKLRSALSLYWQAQCANDEMVRFALTMFALEVLAGDEAPEKLLSARLGRGQRKKLLAQVRAVLADYPDLDGRDVERLMSRIGDTDLQGSTSRLVQYLNDHLHPEVPGAGEPVTSSEVHEWMNDRGSYVHDGRARDEREAKRAELYTRLGYALGDELDAAVDASEKKIAPPGQIEQATTPRQG